MAIHVGSGRWLSPRTCKLDALERAVGARDAHAVVGENLRQYIMGRKTRKNEGPRTTKPSTTHRQDPPPGPTTTESATAEAAEAVEAGSEEATAHAASPPVAKQSAGDSQPTIGPTSHASAVAEVDSLRAASPRAESPRVAAESPRGPVFWGWGDGSPRSNQPEGSNATLVGDATLAAVMSSSACVPDAGAEGADSTLQPPPLSAVPPEEASPTRQSPPCEPPSTVLAGSAAMSPPQPASPVLAAATPEVRSPAASPDPAPLPPPPPQHLPPPPPPQHPPPAPAAPAAAPINPSAESRSSRVQALLRRTAQLTEVASARSSAPATAEGQSCLAPRAPSPTLVAAQLPRLPRSPQLPAQEATAAAAAAAAATSADFPLRVVQARLSSLGQLRARVEVALTLT